MSHITTHILDAALGRPAASVAVELWDGDSTLIAAGTTDADGRCSSLGPDSLPPGPYRLVFAVAPYFAATERASFYPQVTIDFTVSPGEAHYHVPLLLSPFAYSTYRGS
ncbi:hydroxyisourate hydrolase [Micrococcales bacterium 31B]|nr:hydroxyisourate hydrolase [Micrococcales bacterium 31B]